MQNMPQLGLGTFRLKGEAVIESVSTGLELGYRHIDTAQIYGNEADIGQALAATRVARDDLFVTTKIWLANLDRATLRSSLEASLGALQVDHVDLTLIHWPAKDDGVPLRESMEALAEAQSAGLTRQIGVSNFTIGHLKQAIDVVGAKAIATNQIEVHPFLQNRKVTDFMAGHGIAVTGYMPLAYGKVLEDPVLQQIATAHGVSPAQVALAWQLQLGHTVIPSSTRRENLASNLAARDLKLTDAEMAAIAALDRGERLVSPDFAPQWD
ncbi:2,5-didehydrogluconate reductase DkgB [Cupriavidus agavae]|uniref:2,5-diketo-D-gluconate reductase B n=1 Tax=Cupriavidus agavae TaxID=1001822 RepID=A0A4Q7S8F4_9BURK|nr:2,5-didehydrogluconate reductase DkgB [Cupriavidus agavae]RZT42030.1 2,5-diketo-D-gluconate reductase B [Cupriavidus agavae]